MITVNFAHKWRVNIQIRGNERVSMKTNPMTSTMTLASDAVSMPLSRDPMEDRQGGDGQITWQRYKKGGSMQKQLQTKCPH